MLKETDSSEIADIKSNYNRVSEIFWGKKERAFVPMPSADLNGPGRDLIPPIHAGYMQRNIKRRGGGRDSGERGIDAAALVLIKEAGMKSLASRTRTAEGIVDYISSVFNVSKDDLLGKSRKYPASIARHVLYWSVRHELKLSYPKIASLFFVNDHTTIIYGCVKIELALQTINAKKVAKDERESE